ncbi:MAG: hypothetical protein ABII01_05375 [Candidatus Woesearchaeota archaeon]
MDLDTLEPINPFAFHPLFDKQWINKIELAFDTAKSKDISIKEIANNIPGISNLRAQLYFFLLDLKSSKTEEERRKKLSKFIHDIILAKVKNDPHAHHSNIMHSSIELNSIMKKDFTNGNPEISKVLGRLYTACYHLVNGLYTDFYTDFSAENFGPYHLDNDHILVIKHFHDLRPLLVWPDLKTPCKTVTIYTIYKDIEFSCEAISCHSHYKGDPITGLTKFLVEADGKMINDLESIKQLSQSISLLSVEQWKKLTSMNKELLKRKCLFMRCYIMKPLFDHLGIDWRPTPEMIDAVKDKEFVFNLFNPPKDNQDDYWKKVLDPELDTFS